MLLIILAALVVYGYRVWDAPLDRTEPHRALVAHQMVTGGSWLLPRLNGELYLRKPPGIYWAEAAVEKLTGVAEPWAWRLPSVLSSAVLAAGLAAWAGRWFGPAAVAAAGVTCLALVPLWDQDRGADIDALNTAAAVATAVAVLELNYGPASANGARRWPWVAALGAGSAALLLLKGPAGLPPVLGALVGPAVVLRDWKWARRAGVWVGLGIGVLAFVAWAVAVKAAVRRAGITQDTGGVREGLQRMVLHRGRDVLPALAAPFLVLAYATPVVLAAPLAVRLARREPPATARRVTALLATVAAGLLFFVAAGNGNPRYEYLMLPPLAVVAGAVVAGRRHLLPGEAVLVRVVTAAFAVLLAGLAAGVTVKVWRTPGGHVSRAGLVVAAAVCVAAAAAWVVGPARAWVAGLVVVALAVPMGERKNVERQQRSGIAAAAQLRSIVVGGGEVAVASLNRDMPELTYYAGVAVHAYGEHGLPALAAAPGGRWAIVTQSKLFPEYRLLTAQVPGAFPRGVTKLALPTAREQVYVGWYDPPAGTPRAVSMPPTPADEGDE